MLDFKGSNIWKRPTSFDITVVISCKGYDWKRPFFVETVCVEIWPELAMF